MKRKLRKGFSIIEYLIIIIILGLLLIIAPRLIVAQQDHPKHTISVLAGS
jgi:competence protein ComGC